jgi:hypothetical protein
LTAEKVSLGSACRATTGDDETMRPQTNSLHTQQVITAAAERRRLQEEAYRNGNASTSTPRGLAVIAIIALVVYAAFTTWLLWQQ